MQTDYLIKVVSHNEVAGEKEENAFVSRGSFIKNDDGYTLTYTDSLGETLAKTELIFENPQRLTIKRNGDMQTVIHLEKGKRNISAHTLAFGEINLGVTALEISSRLDESCGCLHFKYETDTDGVPLGLMDFYISFHKKGTKQTLHF